MPAPQISPPSPRVRIKRFGQRGRYDRATILAVLDTAIQCHVGFVHNEQPFVLPTLFWRDDESLYFHGSALSRMVKAIDGKPVCVTVSHLDALVLTRSAFHHSANYRSVTILGVAQVLSDPEICEQHLKAMMDRLFPGRWETLRPVKPKEINATRIVALPLAEASAKIRTGPPDEERRDLAWPAWGGLVPIRTVIDPPEADAICQVRGDLPVPHCPIRP